MKSALQTFVTLAALCVSAFAQLPLPPAVTNRAAAVVVNSATNSVTWDGVPGVRGYRLYYGGAIGHYTNSTPLVTTNAVRITEVALPIYAVAVSIAADGTESEFSNMAARLPDAEDLHWFGQMATNVSGPFGGDFPVLVKSNVTTQAPGFTRLRGELRKRVVTLP